MKLVPVFVCLVLYGAVATPFYEVTDQEESPFNDALYKKKFPSGNLNAIQQESNTDQDMDQDDKEGQPTAVVQFNPRVVVQGSTIALQCVFDKRTWMSCFSSDCRKSGCPVLRMDPHDWTNCWGEVFQIYRQGGNGNVHVGDVVGIHYPREHGQWFSMHEGRGHKNPCPGHPNPNTGFANHNKWNECWGETFKIFARGFDGRVKSIGEVIKDRDVIMLCYFRQNKFVSFFDVSDLRTCPGTAYPPPANKYDECWGEVAELWLR